MFGGVARLRLDELAASLKQIFEMDGFFAPLEAKLSKSQKLEIIVLRKHGFPLYTKLHKLIIFFGGCVPQPRPVLVCYAHSNVGCNN
jgi:hypothetical protein